MLNELTEHFFLHNWTISEGTCNARRIRTTTLLRFVFLTLVRDNTAIQINALPFIDICEEIVNLHLNSVPDIINLAWLHHLVERNDFG